MTATQQILKMSMTAYGGWERWQQIKKIRFQMQAGGWALRLKWRSQIFAKTQVQIFPEQPFVRMDPFPKAPYSGGLNRHKVWIEDVAGQMVSERLDPRPFFKKFRRKFYWDDLDCLYFGAYALWNYVTQPFLLHHPDIKLQELKPLENNGRKWHRLLARFPDDIPTHSRDQIFYFDEQGFIVRHDYTADVFGSWAKAAHFSMDFTEVDGMVFPTQRRVWFRKKNQQPFRHFTLVNLRLSEIKIEWK